MTYVAIYPNASSFILVTSITFVLFPLGASFLINLNTKYVPKEPMIISPMHNEAIPKCVTKDIMPSIVKPAQFKYSIFDKNWRNAIMPNNGIYDDKKSINGANPIKLLTFNPFAIIGVFVIKRVYSYVLLR